MDCVDEIAKSRYRFDSPFNLVLACNEVNNKMRDTLKPVEVREQLLARVIAPWAYRSA